MFLIFQNFKKVIKKIELNINFEKNLIVKKFEFLKKY